ncbi:hypothetical protein ACOME3_001158 [Neoechinorhynchus agilis]
MGSEFSQSQANDGHKKQPMKQSQAEKPKLPISNQTLQPGDFPRVIGYTYNNSDLLLAVPIKSLRSDDPMIGVPLSLFKQWVCSLPVETSPGNDLTNHPMLNTITFQQPQQMNTRNNFEPSCFQSPYR